MMTERRKAEGIRWILTIELRPGPQAESLERLLADIARKVGGRLTRAEYAGHPEHPTRDVWLRRRTLVKPH